MDERIERIRRRAQELTLDDASHDFSHTERVVRMCRRLGEKAGADMDVLVVAALLHDAGLEEELKHGKDHAACSADMAREILTEEGFDGDFVEKACYAIRVHRYGMGMTPETTEAEILQDADRLDAMGAIGIARALADRRGRRMYDLSEVPGTYDPFAERSALTHMKEKLLKLKDALHTEEAVKIAEGRHRFMETFVRELEEEIEGKK